MIDRGISKFGREASRGAGTPARPTRDELDPHQRGVGVTRQSNADGTVSLLYEKQRVLHRRGLDQLEAEMMAFSREWDRAVDGSPNRLDAMIWGITRLSKIITHIPIA